MRARVDGPKTSERGLGIRANSRQNPRFPFESDLRRTKVCEYLRFVRHIVGANNVCRIVGTWTIKSDVEELFRFSFVYRVDAIKVMLFYSFHRVHNENYVVRIQLFVVTFTCVLISRKSQF